MKEYCNREQDKSHISVVSEGAREQVEKYRAKFVKEARLISSINHLYILIYKCTTFYKDKYRIEQQKYYFTVSSLLPHKNLGILLEVMKTIKNYNIFVLFFCFYILTHHRRYFRNIYTINTHKTTKNIITSFNMFLNKKSIDFNTLHFFNLHKICTF